MHSSAGRPLGEDFSLCGLRALGSTEPSSALTLLQHLESPPDRRIAIDLDVTRAVFGVGGLVISQSTTALQSSPLGDLETRGSTKPSSALILLQPMKSRSDGHVAIDLDVTYTAFDVGGLCNSLSAAALQMLPVRRDAPPPGSAAAGGTQLPSRKFSPPRAWSPSNEVLTEGPCCLERYLIDDGDTLQRRAFKPSSGTPSHVYQHQRQRSPESPCRQ